MISKGKILRLLRESLNLRQDFVASKTGISAGYLSLIEQGKRNPTNDVLSSLADIYGVPIYLLVWNEDDLVRVKNKDERELIEGINSFIEKLFFLVMGRNEKKTTPQKTGEKKTVTM